MYSCFTKIIYKLTFPIACSEQFLRAIWNAVSSAIVLILPQIKCNSTVVPFFFFFLSLLAIRGNSQEMRLEIQETFVRKWYLVLDSFCMSGSDSKEAACNAGSPGSITGFRISLGEGNGYPLQYSCLDNSMDRGAWRAIVHGVAKSRTQLSN